jgi:hypothetical protein
MRHDTQLELEILNELYGFLRLYSNFFQPVMKLLEKTRVGSKVRKNTMRHKHRTRESWLLLTYQKKSRTSFAVNTGNSTRLN